MTGFEMLTGWNGAIFSGAGCERDGRSAGRSSFCFYDSQMNSSCRTLRLWLCRSPPFLHRVQIPRYQNLSFIDSTTKYRRSTNKTNMNDMYCIGIGILLPELSHHTSENFNTPFSTWYVTNSPSPSMLVVVPCLPTEFPEPRHLIT